MRGLPSKANKAGYVSVGVLFAALAFAGCTFYPPISGSGVLVEATADFEGFSRVSADSTFDVTVVADSSYGVTVTVDDNILEHVRMDRDGQELRIGLDPWYSYRNVTVKALVSMPVLSGVELAGASSLAVTDGGFPSAPAFEANVSGASTLSVPDIAAGSFALVLSGASTASVGVTAGTVGLEVSGASRLTAGGSTGKMVAGVSGASEVDLRGLPGTDADLEISGASRMWVDLSGVVDADVSGGSTLHYRGGLTWGRLRVSGGSLLKPY